MLSGVLMQKMNIAGEGVRLVLNENILAVFSDKPLRTVSSAIYNGGFKNVTAILNIQVPEGFSDSILHQRPVDFALSSSKKLGIRENFLAMITAANIDNFSAVTRGKDGLAVTAIATAGCSHAETAGEEIPVQKIDGTINIIVVIDGNPTDSCLTSTLLTATEAKTAALQSLDIRSRYSGAAATGTITDSMVTAATGKGETIEFGGPASKLGQLVAYCTRTAVKEAVTKQDGCMPSRSVLNRLKERKLPIERLAAGLAKASRLDMDEQSLCALLVSKISTKPVFAAMLMAAAMLNEDVDRGLIPHEFGDVESLGSSLGGMLYSRNNCSSSMSKNIDAKSSPEFCGLSPFLIRVLESLVKGELDETAENFK
jgi:iron complex transport system ATP-binding protein